MNLQTEYDMRVATRELKDKIAPRIRVHEHGTTGVDCHERREQKN